jgi:hypothetical protein
MHSYFIVVFMLYLVALSMTFICVYVQSQKVKLGRKAILKLNKNTIKF